MSNEFVFQRMYTYLGNKRKLLDAIEHVVIDVKKKLGKERMSILDGFTGSTVVARMLTRHASEIHANDMETHAYIAAGCFIQQPTPEQKLRIEKHIAAMNSITDFIPGIVTDMYAPQNTQDIKEGERCFFTHENALRIDTWRTYVETTVEADIKQWCLCPILVQMSTHANTLGHLKAFIKDKQVIGNFEVSGKRVTDPLKLDVPVWNDQPCEGYAYRKDINTLVREWSEEGKRIDLIYYDPPYNQHEYGAYYFLLNVVAENKRPTKYNQVTGLPKERTKSQYNTKAAAIKAMEDLIASSLRVARYILISYNDEGLIGADDWKKLLEPYTYERFDREYQRYVGRGTETGKGRSEVIETMYLVSGFFSNSQES